MTKVELNLPDQLASELELVGLLTPAAVEKVLREELRARRRKILDEVLAKRDADSSPPMSTEEIQAEIDAYRAEKRRAAGS